MIVVTSWDDGHPLDERLGELLQRHGFTGTFFVPVRNTEGLPVISGGALRTLAATHEIGGHTLDHVRLAGLPVARAREQVCGGRDQLQQLIGRPLAGFCYPGGRFDAQSMRIVREAGFQYARTVENLVIAPPTDRYRIGTTLQVYAHPPAVLARNLLRYPGRAHKAPLLLRLLAGASLEERLRIAARYAHGRAGVLHLWGHSWELERHGLWQLLDGLLRWLPELGARPQSLAQLVGETR